MKSLFRGLVEHMSSLVKVPSAAAAAAAATAPLALGRWGIQYDEKVIDRKINQANEDHCGCCVDVVVVGDGMKKKKKEPEAEVNSVVRYEKTEEYLLPYVM
jgi:hypothetical protein